MIERVLDARTGALCLLLLGAACASAPKPAKLSREAEQLDRDLRAALAEHPDVRASIWLSAPRAEPSYWLYVDEPMPTASAIKTAYLVELFASHGKDLDAPFPDAKQILDNPRHPAVAHFSAEQRATALKALGDASVRRVGEAMISGKGVDNATYNIAANLVTAHFEGPAWLESRLHARGGSWQEFRVRRYMLADRNNNGDNVATARALAAVLGELASGRARGLTAETLTAAREILAQPDDAAGRHRFAKGGALNTAPITRVASGWREGPKGTIVYVVMLAGPAQADAQQPTAERIDGLMQRIQSLLLAAAE